MRQECRAEVGGEGVRRPEVSAAGINGAGVWEADTGAKLVHVPSPIQLPLWRLFGDCRVDPGWVISAPSSAVWALHAPLNITALALDTACCPVYSGVLNLPTMGSLRVMRCNAQPTIAHQAQRQVSLKTGHEGPSLYYFTTVKVPAPGPSRQCPVHSDGDPRRCPAYSAWCTLG